MLTDRDRSIITQTAFKEAGRNLENPAYQAGVCGSNEDVASWHAWFSQELDFITNEIFRKHTEIESYGSTDQAQGALQQAFPGAVPAGNGGYAATPATQPYVPAQQYAQGAPPMQAPQPYQAPQQYAPQPQQYQPPQQGFQAPQQQGYAPQPPVATMDNDTAWSDLLNNPHMWKDERRNKRQPTSPDYVHVSLKKANGKDLALWLHGQYGQPPAHIYQALQQQGRA